MTHAQLEQQAEQNRAAVANTLEELNNRLTPGQIVDQVVDYMKNGGGEFFGNLGKQVTANPIPVTLAGAGLAWFLLARNSTNGGTVTGSSTTRSTMNGIGEAASSAADRMSDTASKVGTIATSAVDGVSSSVQAVGDAATTAYNQAAESLSSLKTTAITAEERAMAAAKNLMTFCQDQPLILAGAGLAFGAIIGAVLPHTEAEDELLGETSDDMKEAAKELAVDQLDKAKAIGAKLGEALSKETENAMQTENTNEMTPPYSRPSDKPESVGFH